MTSETPALPAAPAPAAPAGPAHAAPEPAPTVEVSTDGGQTFTPVPGVHVAADGTETPLPTPTAPAEPEALAAPAWPHQHLDWHGDRLEIRVPKRGAVAVLQLTLTTSFDQATQNEATARFLRLHLSPASLARVNERMSDPDDADYPVNEDFLPLIVAMIEHDEDPATDPADPAAT